MTGGAICVDKGTSASLAIRCARPRLRHPASRRSARRAANVGLAPERAAIDAYGWDSLQRLKTRKALPVGIAISNVHSSRPRPARISKSLMPSWVMARLTPLSSPAISFNSPKIDVGRPHAHGGTNQKLRLQKGGGPRSPRPPPITRSGHPMRELRQDVEQISRGRNMDINQA